MEATTLKISNAINKLGKNYRIGNLFNKNLLIRNLALMRNIGKYSLYSEPMFPEIGMAYNIYERLLNRPEDIGLINGLIGLNNAMTDDDELLGTGGFKIYDFKTEDGGDSIKRDVYVTNSDSVRRSGGEEALGTVLNIVSKYIAGNTQYDYFGVGMSVDKPSYTRTSYGFYNVTSPDGFLPFTITRSLNDSSYGFINGDTQYNKQYKEGKGYSNDELNKNLNTPTNEQVLVIDEGVSYGDNLSDYYSPKNNQIASLIKKTNALFNDGKINSIITRFYIKDGDEYLSRGRNLKKKGAKNEGNGYDNPYCRVWTAHNQYNRMKDLIRPRTEDDKFLSIKEIQGNYGDGLRPQNGASRLSDMSVLKPNGLVNFAPHLNEDGTGIDSESVKKCMFSIENLAWRDIEINEDVTTRKYWNEKEHTYVSQPTIGGTLSPEQRGPNGGRIMWFPPYNLKFSEDVVTNWNQNTFIGRGENMYTYVNTERSGSLSFTLLIDHPSIINKWNSLNPNTSTYEDEQRILRFFAGCDDLGDESRNNEDEPTNNQETPKDIVTPKQTAIPKEVKIMVFFPNDYSGVDEREYDVFFGYMYRGEDCQGNVAYESSNSGSVLTEDNWYKDWRYKVDKKYKDEKLQIGGTVNNYQDLTGYTLNNFTKDMDQHVKTKMVGAGFITSTDVYGTDFYSFHDLCRALEKKDNVKTGDSWLDLLLNTDQINNIDRVEIRGYASSHGYAANNNDLAKNRAETIRAMLMEKKPGIDKSKYDITRETPLMLDSSNKNVSSLDAKLYRSVEIIFYVSQNKEVKQAASKQEETTSSSNMTTTSKTVKKDYMYDDEYTYFKEVKESDSFIRNRITEKVKFFDPAFHSITPEGFNARLTFLHQCTRQGPTVSASDGNNKNESTGVGNLAFGRAPYCVLRIGDFYNTKILIESINISYDTGGSPQWDLNPEGVGVQPMMAEVQMRFKFVGGTDISGPIERLQNAVSFNYYSNASIYDRRADYRGAFIDKSEGNPLYFFDARTQDKDKNKNIGG